MVLPESQGNALAIGVHGSHGVRDGIELPVALYNSSTTQTRRVTASVGCAIIHILLGRSTGYFSWAHGTHHYGEQFILMHMPE